MRTRPIYLLAILFTSFVMSITFFECQDKKEQVEISDLYLGEKVVYVHDTITVEVVREVPTSFSTVPCVPKTVEILREVPVIKEVIVEVEKEVIVEIPVFQEKIVEVEVIREVEVQVIDPMVTEWLFGQISNLKLTEDHQFQLYGNSGVYSLPDRKTGWNLGFTGLYRGVEAGIAYDPLNNYYQARIGYRIFQSKQDQEENDILKNYPDAND